MNIKRIIKYFTILFIPMYIAGSFLSVFQARSGDGKILSPNKTKNIQFISFDNRTQILCNFHKVFRIVGSNVAILNLDESKIKVLWIDDNRLEIRYPKHADISNQENDLYFFGDTVDVSFLPE